MKAFEFEAEARQDGSLALPPEIAEQVKGQYSVRVLLLVADDDEDERDWVRMGMAQFAKGYAEDDAYDQLPPG